MKKSKKKQTQKKSLVNKNSAVMQKANLEPEDNSFSPSLFKQVDKKYSFYLGLGLVLLIIVSVLYAFRGLFVVAFVNNQPISRLTVIRDLENQAGKQVLSSLVTKALIEQEAKKRNITVDEKTLDNEIKKIETKVKQQGQNLDTLLSMQNMTRAAFKDQLKIQKVIELMFKKEASVTNKEVDDYIAKNTETLGENPNKNDIKSELSQQKLSEAFQKWLEKAKKEAKITYFHNY